MKSQALKKLIKESVREVIHEELREILLEAVKAPKQTISSSTPTISPTKNKLVSEDKRAAYANILGETAAQFTSADVKPRFNPQGVLPGGDLPSGELGMDQIMGLMNKK